MSDVLFGLWLDSFLNGGDPAARRQICRAMLLCGASNRFFEAFDSPTVRIGHRRWSLT